MDLLPSLLVLPTSNDMETIMSNQTYVKTSSRNTSSKVREVLHKCHCLPRIYT